MALVSDSAKVDRRHDGRRRRRACSSGSRPLVGIAAFLLAWQLFVVVYNIPPYLLPTPPQIAETFIDALPGFAPARLGHGL